MAKHAKKYRLDPKRIAVAGDSVGGNMATVVAMLAKERGGPKIDFQLLFYPVTDANFTTESYLKFGGGDYWLSTNAMKWFWDAYAPDVAIRTDYHVSPLRATVEQLHGLPPALIITDENDVLRDEGEAYAHKLMRAGVTVTSVRYLGTIHDFVMLDPLKNIPSTRNAINLAISMLKQVFHPTPCK
jgi:acetyl esterase